MKYFSISHISRLPAAFFIFVLFTVLSACKNDPPDPEPDSTKDIVGEYIGTLTIDNDETPNVKLTVEKVNEKTVIVRPQLPGATAFRAEITFSGPQLTQPNWTGSETSGHKVTGSLAAAFQPVPKSFEYIGEVIVNGQSRYESFRGNKQ